jgi:hypothetical protein
MIVVQIDTVAAKTIIILLMTLTDRLLGHDLAKITEKMNPANA